MTDIVERLIALATSPVNASFIGEAADEIETLRQRVKDLEYEAGYTRPIAPGDNTYPNPMDVAACLRNCSDDLLTEARFVLWQGKEIETLRHRVTQLENTLKAAGAVQEYWCTKYERERDLYDRLEQKEK